MHHRQGSPERDLVLDLSQVRLSKERARKSGEVTPDSKPPHGPKKTPSGA